MVRSTPGGKKRKAVKASPSIKAKKPGATTTTTPLLSPPTTDLQNDKSHVGRRVSKNFDGEVYGGTVSKFIPKYRLWAVEYDDGDGEEMDWNDLSIAMGLHDGNEGGGSQENEENKENEEKEENEENEENEEKEKKKNKKKRGRGAAAKVTLAQDAKPPPAAPATPATASPASTAADRGFRVVRRTCQGGGRHGRSGDEERVVGEYATRETANDAARAEMGAARQFEGWGEGRYAGESPPYSSAEGPFDAAADGREFVDIRVVAADGGEERVAGEGAAGAGGAGRGFGDSRRAIVIDPGLFARNPCRVPGGTNRDPGAYPNFHKGMGSFGFLIQRLSDRNYAMRALCVDGRGAEYNTYKKKGVNYISVVWYPPSNLDDHAGDATIVDGCHLDLIDPKDGRTYLTGPNLESAIVNAAAPVECLFLNGAESNRLSVISADDIASAISRCSDSLRCVSLAECKLNAALLRALASCPRLRGLIVENCQLWGEGDDGPTDAGLAAVLRSRPDLRWCFVKSSVFGARCWEALAEEGACPGLEVLWVDAPTNTGERVDATRGDHDVVRRALDGRAGTLRVCMINPDERNRSRYVVGGGERTDRLNGRARTDEEKRAMKMMPNFRVGSYLNTV